jgi:hypothetical protein
MLALKHKSLRPAFLGLRGEARDSKRGVLCSGFTSASLLVCRRLTAGAEQQGTPQQKLSCPPRENVDEPQLAPSCPACPGEFKSMLTDGCLGSLWQYPSYLWGSALPSSAPSSWLLSSMPPPRDSGSLGALPWETAHSSHSLYRCPLPCPSICKTRFLRWGIRGV